MILVGPVKCRHCHVSLHAFGRFSQRLSAPVISSSRPSANEDLPLPLRPTTTVRPGAGSSLSVAGRPIPRNPSTVTSFSHTGGEASVGRRRRGRVRRELDDALGLGVELARLEPLQQQGAKDGVHGLDRLAIRRWVAAIELPNVRHSVATSPFARACSRTNSHCGISSAAANALASSSMSRALASASLTRQNSACWPAARCMTQWPSSCPIVNRRRGGHCLASCALTQISPRAGSSSPDSA